jgi:hypothetical protein
VTLFTTEAYFFFIALWVFLGGSKKNKNKGFFKNKEGQIFMKTFPHKEINR